jgi:hypothetical protein
MQFERCTILHNLKRLLAGETAVNVNVREMPTTPEAVKILKKILGSLFRRRLSKSLCP